MLGFGSGESQFLCFKNDDLQKKVNALYLAGECVEFWTENASIHTKDSVAALLMMAYMVFGSLLR